LNFYLAAERVQFLSGSLQLGSTTLLKTAMSAAASACNRFASVGASNC
jgi:hypothetical protein